jgi:hypothetical protein
MATLNAAEVQELDPSADEGGHAAAVIARGMSRPAYVRKMAWLWPRMSRAVPYLGYVLMMARKPELPAQDRRS